MRSDRVPARPDGIVRGDESGPRARGGPGHGSSAAARARRRAWPAAAKPDREQGGMVQGAAGAHWGK